jgi:GNAT superfamily N-acetyltransferase
MGQSQPPISKNISATRASNGVLADLSDINLAAAVELNSAEWLRLKGRLPWVEFHDDGDAVWLTSGDTWPGSSVALAQFTPETAHKRIGEILDVHLAAKVACNWSVGSVSKPANLGQHLRTHGFKCMIHCSAMACNLAKLPPSPTVPTGIGIELFDRPPSLQPLTTERRRRRHEGRAQLADLKPRQIWHFIASANGKPVGETTLCTGAGVAGIYGVEVLEKFRGRGIGTALVHAAVTFARETLGYRAAVLAATGMGVGVYARVGFREVSKLSFWKYGKMRQQMRLSDVFRKLLTRQSSSAK